jgi:hypothetical protein
MRNMWLNPKKKTLMVMADFSSSGIWQCSDNLDLGGGMIDFDELKLSPELIKQFEAWIDYYDTCFKSDWSTFKKNKSKKLNEMGLWCAKELKKELPNNTHVKFRGEDETDMLEIIEV